MQTSKETQTDRPVKKELPDTKIPPQEVDYKKKFSESTRENQRILEEGAELKRRTLELESQLEETKQALSDKELMEKYPDWEFMDENARRKARVEVEKEKRLKILEAKEKWREDYRKLPQEIKDRIDKKGGEEEFKDFACSPENCGQKNLMNLVKQFLYEEPVPAPPPPPKEEEEEIPGLETGTGGTKVPFVSKKGYTTAEAEEMRKKDSRKYNKLVEEGRMKIID